MSFLEHAVFPEAIHTPSSPRVSPKGRKETLVKSEGGPGSEWLLHRVLDVLR